MPRTMTVHTEVFGYHELSEKAKEAALDAWAQENEFFNDFVYEDAVRVAELLGIEIDSKPVKLMNGSTRYDPAIFFSGFWSQGDGACFEGSYRYRKILLNA